MISVRASRAHVLGSGEDLVTLEIEEQVSERVGLIQIIFTVFQYGRSPSPYFEKLDCDTNSGSSMSSAINSLFSFTSPAVKKLLGWKQGDEEEKW